MNGDFKKASHYCSHSCEAVEKVFGSSSVEYAHELYKLSQLLFNDRQVKKALSTIDKATSLLSRHYGRSNPDVLLGPREVNTAISLCFFPIF